MRTINPNPAPVKLFMDMLSNDIPLFDEIKRVLEDIYGEVETESPLWPWDHTEYYIKEMGEGLKRKFIFFKEHIDMPAIRDVKLKAVVIRPYDSHY